MTGKRACSKRLVLWLAAASAVALLIAILCRQTRVPDGAKVAPGPRAHDRPGHPGPGGVARPDGTPPMGTSVVEGVPRPADAPESKKGAIRVRVLDSTANDPLPGAVVWLLFNGQKEARQLAAGLDGKAEFLDLQQGDYRVEAYASKSSNIVGDSRCSIRDGTETSLTIHLPCGSCVEGEVVDQHDVPIEGATVHLQNPIHAVEDAQPSDDHWKEQREMLARYTCCPIDLEQITAADGRFCYSRLLPLDSEAFVKGGQTPIYRVRARHQGYAQASARVRALPAGSKVHLVLKMLPGVATTTVKGRVTDRAGLPVQGARVYLKVTMPKGGPDTRRFRSREAATGEEGGFELNDDYDQLGPELDQEAFLVVEKEGYVLHSQPFSGRSGDVVTDIAVVLENGLSVTGQVEDPEGHTVGPLSLFWSALPRASSDGSWVKADASGRFRLEGLVDGQEYVILAQHPSHGEVEVRFKAPQPLLVVRFEH